LDSKGTLEFSGEYIQVANATGGIVSFVLAFVLIDRTYRHTLSLRSCLGKRFLLKSTIFY
jgi:hypothetical protein